MKLKFIERAPRAPGLSRTLVLLHGYGADEHDLLPLAHELDPRLRAVSLRAPISLGGAMRAWFNLTQDARGLSYDAAEVRAGIEAAAAAVEEIAASSPRPILLGFSQGGGMALGVALTRPGLAAGVLSLSGVMRALDPSDIPRPAAVKGFPVFAAHGEQDPIVPIELVAHRAAGRLRLLARVPDGPHGDSAGARGREVLAYEASLNRGRERCAGRGRPRRAWAWKSSGSSW